MQNKQFTPTEEKLIRAHRAHRAQVEPLLQEEQLLLDKLREISLRIKDAQYAWYSERDAIRYTLSRENIQSPFLGDWTTIDTSAVTTE